nr:restriction endonuclease subunit S [Paraprevotella clara]
MNSYYEKFIATGEVKCIDEEIPFEIPQGWEWERLGNITTIKGGKRIPVGMNLSTIDTGHKYIRVADMKNHSIKNDDIHYITDEIYEKIKAYIISKDDLYITVAGTIGNVGIVPEEFNNANLTENADKIEIYALCKLYLLYTLLSDVVQEQIRECTTKVGQPKLAIIRIQNFLIPIAPLAEQKRISNRIEVLLPIVDKYEFLSSKLVKLNSSINEFLKKSILQEAIQGKLVPQIAEEGAAQELLEQIKAEKEKLVKEGKLKKSALTNSVIYKGDDNKYFEKIGEIEKDITDEIPFEIPDSWAWVRHNDLFDISGGSQPPKSIFQTQEKEGYIRLFQIRDYGPNPQPVHIPLSTASKISQKGDILLARYGASLGKVFYAEYGAYNVALAKVIPLYESPLIFQKYIFLYYCNSSLKNSHA